MMSSVASCRKLCNSTLSFNSASALFFISTAFLLCVIWLFNAPVYASEPEVTFYDINQTVDKGASSIPHSFTEY